MTIGLLRRLAPSLLVLVLALGWALFVGSLAVARDENLRTNAFDLGYISQALWNTSHGEPFRLTVLEGATFQPEGLDPSRIRQPHSYLAFHVEPIDLPLAGLHALWPDPRFLLWLQAAVVALGALPAAWLARSVVARASEPAPANPASEPASASGTSEPAPANGAAERPGGRLAGVAFGVAWLLAPGLEGAALSDFHAVALGAACLMAGFWLLESGRPRWAWALLMLAAISREDGALAVAWLGVVLLLRSALARARSRCSESDERGGPPPRLSAAGAAAAAGRGWFGGLGWLRAAPGGRAGPRFPLTVLVPAALWTLLCFGVIAPYFNGGGSLFWSRYAWLGSTPRSAAVGLLRNPRPLLAWLTAPDVAAYVAIQLLTGGLLLLLAPLEALAALPLLAINALSSFDWMRSGGAHYSALLVPLLLWAGAHGLRHFLSLWERAGVRASPRAPSVLGAAVVLASALTAHLWIGASPLRPDFAWPDADPRAPAVLAALAAVPPDAPASASSAIYPHLADRHRLYWYPALQDAQYLAVDVAGTSHPLTAPEMRDSVGELLGTGEWDVVAARDGLLVLRRGEPGQIPGGGPAATARAPASGVEVTGPSDLPARAIGQLPDALLTFVHVRAPAGPVAGAPLRFGDALELVGARLHRWPQVGLFGDAAVLETTWRATAPLPMDLTFALATTRRSDGALVGLQPDLAPTPLWYPTSRWEPGDLIRLEMPVDRLADLRALGVAVLDPSGARLAVSGGPNAVLWENTIAAVASAR